MQVLHTPLTNEQLHNPNIVIQSACADTGGEQAVWICSGHGSTAIAASPLQSSMLSVAAVSCLLCLCAINTLADQGLSNWTQGIALASDSVAAAAAPQVQCSVQSSV